MNVVWSLGLYKRIVRVVASRLEVRCERCHRKSPHGCSGLDIIRRDESKPFPQLRGERLVDAWTVGTGSLRLGFVATLHMTVRICTLIRFLRDDRITSDEKRWNRNARVCACVFCLGETEIFIV